MGRRSADGRAISKFKDTTPTFAKFTRCDYVQGGTLARWVRVDKTTYWVYNIPFGMLEIQCDACVRKHSAANLECSATIGRTSPFQDPEVLYDFKTREPVMPVPATVVYHGNLKAAIAEHKIE